MSYEVIHLNPTLDTSAYADNDVLFVSEPIKLPARSCKVLSVQAVWEDTQVGNIEMILFFHRENVNILGASANAVASANNAEFRPDSGSFLSCIRLNSDSTVEAALGPSTLLISNSQRGDNIGENLGPNGPAVVCSGTEDNKIYVSAYLEVGAAVTVAADSLDIFIQVEY